MMFTILVLASYKMISAQESTTEKVMYDVNSFCSVYLADSSIKNAGFGVFAGKHFEIGERIGSGGLGIQVLDSNDDGLETELMVDYGWSPTSVGGDMEADSVFTVLPGIGMLVNFHPSLSNVMAGGLTDEVLFDRRLDPNAGAITSYHNFTFLAKERVKRGEELFGSVADNWFMDHETDKNDDISPLGADYLIADKLLNDLANFKLNHPDLSEAAFLDVILRLKTEILNKNKNIHKLIPESTKEILEASKKGSAKSILNERSMEWIAKNGKCLDNLRADNSTIAGAGRGAFTTRFIQEGTVITPAPLVHIMDKSKLLIKSNNTDGSETKYQLLLNYCFGHKNSSLLLCPTTSAVLINHHREKANAIIQWAEPSINQKNVINYRMRPMEDLEAQSLSLSDLNTKLAFDIVATRDIAEGEEIFVDYGDEWINAWNNHVKNWKKIDSGKEYTPSSVLNKKQATIREDDTFNHYSYLCELEPFARDSDTFVGNDAPEEDYHANPSLNRDNWDDRIKLLYLENDFIWSWPCEIISSNSDNSIFTVKVLQRTTENPNERPVIRLLKNFPRNSIKFVDKPYHSDQHLSNAFRHYIPIPDDIFPLHWRNDYISAEDVRLGEKDNGETVSEELKEAYLKELREAKCGIYTATSTIPNAGKGVYLGVAMPSAGLDLGPRIPVIPVTDFAAPEWDAFDYTWSATAYNTEYEADNVQVLTTNEGCMSNFHPGLVNMGFNSITHKPLLDRRKDPGAGAFSDYWNFAFKSEYSLDAGQEVFISYGESWFSHRPYLSKVPLSYNYRRANEIVASIAGLSAEPNPTLNEEQVEDILHIIKEDLIMDDRTEVLFNSLSTLKDIQRVLAKNGTAESTSEKRTIEWLEENGECLDHVYVKDSTIPQAGKGAFARRPILLGETIIPSPMLNSWGRDIFNMDAEETPKGINKKQLVYNYMWSHPKSSLLLFPTNTAITINHASDRDSSKILPNAELRWSQTDKKSMYYLQTHLHDLKKEHYATLLLDFVATRDIMPDEEILIDYGEEWENAWNLHVKTFRSPCSTLDEDCLNSSWAIDEMNEDKFNTKNHKWTQSFFSVCHHRSLPSDAESVTTLIPTSVKIDYDADNEIENDENETVYYSKFNYKYSFHGIKYDHHGFELAARADTWYPCMILNADEHLNELDVVYFTYEEPPEYSTGGILRRSHSISPEHVRFINKPYKSDMHWRGAFRHEMKIPDSIFPELWKDLIN